MFSSEDRAEKQCLLSRIAKDKNVINSKASSGHRMFFFFLALFFLSEYTLRFLLWTLESHTALGSWHQLSSLKLSHTSTVLVSPCSLYPGFEESRFKVNRNLQNLCMPKRHCLSLQEGNNESVVLAFSHSSYTDVFLFSCRIIRNTFQYNAGQLNSITNYRLQSYYRVRWAPLWSSFNQNWHTAFAAVLIY